MRLTLLEHIYEQLYMQRLTTPSESAWRARIVPNRIVISASQTSNSGVLLKLADTVESKRGANGDGEEELEVDYVFTATGYARNAHEGMLSEVKGLLPDGGEGKWDVGRDYRVKFSKGLVDEKAGVWLQGCNENTHGVSSVFGFDLSDVCLLGRNGLGGCRLIC